MDNDVVSPQQWYYENRLSDGEAAALEFTRTSYHINWRGKVRCIWCKATGYTWTGCTDYDLWWGHRHGKNCSKRPEPKE